MGTLVIHEREGSSPTSGSQQRQPGDVAVHSGYLVHREPDGTLIWEPAEVLSATEVSPFADEGLNRVIAGNRADPSRLRRRDRSTTRG